MRHSVYTACVPELDPEPAAREIRAAGYDGIEWRVWDSAAPPPAGPWFLRDNRCTLDLSDAAGRRAAEMCRAEGLTIVGLSPYVDTGDIPTVERAMGMAVASGAPRVRIRAASLDGTPYRMLVERTLAYFADVEKLAVRYGVRAVVEIHQGTIGPSASATRALVERFDPAAIGVIMDVGNLAIEGYEDYRMGVAVLSDYLSHVHIKNVGWRREGERWRWYWAPLDDGVVDVAAVLSTLGGAGYDGWLSQEDFSDRESSVELLRRNRAYLAALGA